MHTFQDISIKFIDKGMGHQLLCSLYHIFKLCCMHVCKNKRLHYGFIFFPEKRPTVFYYWNWGVHLQHFKPERSGKGKRSGWGYFPKSLLCKTMFFMTNHLFTLLLKCCIYTTPLLATIVIYIDAFKRPFGSLQVGFTVCSISCLLCPL